MVNGNNKKDSNPHPTIEEKIGQEAEKGSTAESSSSEHTDSSSSYQNSSGSGSERSAFAATVAMNAKAARSSRANELDEGEDEENEEEEEEGDEKDEISVLASSPECLSEIDEPVDFDDMFDEEDFQLDLLGGTTSGSSNTAALASKQLIDDRIEGVLAR